VTPLPRHSAREVLTFDLEEDVLAVFFRQNDGEFAFLDLSGLLGSAEPTPREIVSWLDPAGNHDPRLYLVDEQTVFEFLEEFERIRNRSRRLAVLELQAAAGSRRAVPHLAHILDSADRDERRGAARALGFLGGEEAVEALKARISTEEDPDVLRFLFEALARAGDRSDVAYLEAQANLAGNTRVAEAARRSADRLRNLSEEMPVARLERLVEQRDLAALNHLGPRYVPHFIRLVEDPSVALEVRLVAAHRLGQVGREEDLVEVSGVAFDEGAEPYLRKVLLESFAQARVTGLRIQIETIVTRETFALPRVAALRALAELGDRGTYPTILEAMTDPDRDVRREAARTLGYLSQPVDESYLRYVVDAGNQFLREGGVFYRGYETVRISEALLDLERITSDPFHPSEARAACALMLGMSRQSEAVTLLIDLIRAYGEDRLVRLVAIRAAGYHGDLRFVTPLEDIVADESQPFEIANAARRVLDEL
jgi:HEAT repeat protein